jgi:hypothetical protein
LINAKSGSPIKPTTLEEFLIPSTTQVPLWLLVELSLFFFLLRSFL